MGTYTGSAQPHAVWLLRCLAPCLTLLLPRVPTSCNLSVKYLFHSRTGFTSCCWQSLANFVLWLTSLLKITRGHTYLRAERHLALTLSFLQLLSLCSQWTLTITSHKGLRTLGSHRKTQCLLQARHQGRGCSSLAMVGSSSPWLLWVKEASRTFSIPGFARCFLGESFSVSYSNVVKVH